MKASEKPQEAQVLQEEIKDLSYEEAIKKLEEIVLQLEQSDISLANSVTLYQQGMVLAELCNSKLKSFEEEIQKIKIQEDGTILQETLGEIDHG